MAEIIKMPKLSDTMEEGVVAKWHKKIGDKVKEGEILADIETDKATMEFESFNSGVILYQAAEEGEALPVDEMLVIIGEKGEDVKELIAENKTKNKTTDKENGSSEKEGDSAETSEKKESSEQEKSETESNSKEKIDTDSIKAKIIKMPRLSDTMKEGTVASWAKKVGDKINSGELLAEIETDKATMEFESFEDGVILYQAVEEGDSAPVDTILAIVGEKGADYKKLIQAFEQENATEEKVEGSRSKDTQEENSKEQNASTSAVTKAAVSGEKQNAKTADGRVKISPLAKKMAEEKGFDINQMQGSGDGGRIIKRDVESYHPSQAAVAAKDLGVSEHYEDKPLSQMRKTIAKRLSESKFSAPHFYLTIDLDMDKAIAARTDINAMPDTKISYNDMVIKAAAAALKQHPAVNSSWMEDKVRFNEHVHIGVAVAVEEGLLVPVVRFAEQKQLSVINAEVKDYAKRAKAKKLQPQDWEGSTFSVSNLGMFGIEEFTAIINPPNACIMAIGAIRQEPVVKAGEIVVGNRMKVTLSCDHRVVDGATGAEFLQTFKTFIENPVTLLG